MKNKYIESIILTIFIFALLIESQILFGMNGLSVGIEIYGTIYMIPAFVLIIKIMFYNKNGDFKYE